MKHYTKAELELYRHQQMPLLARLGCTAHLKTCDTCAERLRELAEEDAFVAELRDSLKILGEAEKE